MNMYQVLGDRVGTFEARDLAQHLVKWDDAMVRHLRIVNFRGKRCPEGCPHEEARGLWSAALDVFGDRAAALRFLQRYGAHAYGADTGAVEVHA